LDKVSIIIPVYNRLDYLREALRSARDQSYENVEIIVVDDGSEIDIRSVVEDFPGKGIAYYRQNNRGLSSARNRGIGLCRGKYVVFLDDDDLLEKNMVAECLNKITDNVGVVYSRHEYFGAPGDKAKPEINHHDRPGPDMFKWLLGGNRIVVNSVMVKKEWLETVGGFDEKLKSNEDWDLWLRISHRGCGFGYVAKILAQVRIHENKMQSYRLTMAESGLEVIKKAETYADKNILDEVGLQRIKAYHYLLVGKAWVELGQRKKAREALDKSIEYNVNILNLCYWLGSGFIPTAIFKLAGWSYRKYMGRIY